MPLISTKECFCLSQVSTWISNVICPGLYCGQWFWGKRWVCWYWWNCSPSWLKDFHFITISHIESLNIKRIIDLTYSCFVSYNMGNKKEFNTYRVVRLGKSLNVPTWIDVIWLEFKLLQNIKYVQSRMTLRANKYKAKNGPH